MGSILWSYSFIREVYSWEAAEKTAGGGRPYLYNYCGCMWLDSVLCPGHGGPQRVSEGTLVPVGGRIS